MITGPAASQARLDRPVTSEARGSSVAEVFAPRQGRPIIEAGLPFFGLEAISAENLSATGATVQPDVTSIDPLHPDVIAAMAARRETIIGWDSRMRFNPRSYPNRAIVYISYNGSHLCTGFMISQNTVATSGHCLHTGGSNGQWRQTSLFRVFPGRDGTSSPYGSCGATRLHSVTGWTSNRLATHDYGAIRLDCTVGNTVGWFGMYVPSDTDLTNAPTRVLGYSGDKAQQQWGSSDRIRRIETRMLCYRDDTVGGNSGGPLWHDRDNALNASGAWAFGVHGYGVGGSVCGGGTTQTNGAVRATTAVLNNYIAWINQI
jgi:glutamyl endopeptidase